MEELITEPEIEILKKNPREISKKDVVSGMGIMPPLKLTKLKSGYLVSYTIDYIGIINNKKEKIEHLIVSAEKFEPDPADMDRIALKVLGKCARTNPDWTPESEKTHYIAIMGVKEPELTKAYNIGKSVGITVIEQIKIKN